MRVITISGKAEAGKDLSALLLKEELESEGKKVLIIHYADYLKYIAKQYYGWDGIKDEKGRRLLQILGTEIIRTREPNFWVETVVRLLRVIKDDFDLAFIPDCRFPNEIDVIRDNFETITLKVVRLNYENSLTKEQRNHASETSLDGYSFDYTIESKSGKSNLSIEINKFKNTYLF